MLAAMATIGLLLLVVATARATGTSATMATSIHRAAAVVRAGGLCAVSRSQNNLIATIHFEKS